MKAVRILLLFLSVTLTAGNRFESVLICKSKASYAYHSHYCRGLKQCTHKVEKVSEKEAIRLGYRACKICYRNVSVRQPSLQSGVTLTGYPRVYLQPMLASYSRLEIRHLLL